jgi:hypothetical protein
MNNSDLEICKYYTFKEKTMPASGTLILEKQLVEIHEAGWPSNYYGFQYKSDITIRVADHYCVEFENETLADYLHAAFFNASVYIFEFDGQYLKFDHENKNIRIS